MTVSELSLSVTAARASAEPPPAPGPPLRVRPGRVPSGPATVTLGPGTGPEPRGGRTQAAAPGCRGGSGRAPGAEPRHTHWHTVRVMAGGCGHGGPAGGRRGRGSPALSCTGTSEPKAAARRPGHRQSHWHGESAPSVQLTKTPVLLQAEWHCEWH